MLCKLFIKAYKILNYLIDVIIHIFVSHYYHLEQSKRAEIFIFGEGDFF